MNYKNTTSQLDWLDTSYMHTWMCILSTHIHTYVHTEPQTHICSNSKVAKCLNLKTTGTTSSKVHKTQSFKEKWPRLASRENHPLTPPAMKIKPPMETVTTLFHCWGLWQICSHLRFRRFGVRRCCRSAGVCVIGITNRDISRATYNDGPSAATDLHDGVGDTAAPSHEQSGAGATAIYDNSDTACLPTASVTYDAAGSADRASAGDGSANRAAVTTYSNDGSAAAITPVDLGDVNIDPERARQENLFPMICKFYHWAKGTLIFLFQTSKGLNYIYYKTWTQTYSILPHVQVGHTAGNARHSGAGDLTVTSQQEGSGLLSDGSLPVLAVPVWVLSKSSHSSETCRLINWRI